MSRSDGLRFFIERSDGYQAIDDVEDSFAKTATRFQFLKITVVRKKDYKIPFEFVSI